MESNKFTVKINFESNNQKDKRGNIKKFYGHVLYHFIDGKPNNQRWFVTLENNKEKDFNSISKIVGTYRKSNISGACQKRTVSAVCISDGKYANKYFYSVLPAGGKESKCSMPKSKLKKANLNWDDEMKNSISLEEAFKKAPLFKEYFDKYNGD